MKIKSSVLLGFVVLICLLGGLSLMSRMDVDQDAWCPADMYSSVGGDGNSTYSSVSYASGASEATAVPVVSNAGSLFRHRTVSSYAPAHRFSSHAPAHRSPIANSQYPIGGMPSYSSKGASALYTTSSATMKSFGNGGMSAGVAMSGGSARATSAQPAVAAVVSMPSLPTPASSSTSSAARSSVSMEQLLATASAGSEHLAAASYQGIGKTTAGGPMGMRGRRNVGPEDQWLGWLGSDMWGEGYESWANGSDQVTEEDLFRLWFKGMTGEDYDPSNPAHTAQYNHFMNEGLWQSFLAWFNSNQDDNTFGWYWAAVPVSDAIPFLLLLCALYAWVVYRRAKKQQSSEQC